VSQFFGIFNNLQFQVFEKFQNKRNVGSRYSGGKGENQRIRETLVLGT
jgi:hypothetical protein